MKLPAVTPNVFWQGSARWSRAFTISEVVVAMAIFMLVVAGIISAHLFGLRMVQANESKLTATEWSRKTFGKIADEVRACNSMKLGNITSGVFEAFLDGETQQGAGLMIYPTTSTNNYVLYFLNANDQTFRRATEQANSAVILADSVTNLTVFTALDLAGNVQTNNQNNRVIHLTLEFYQPKRFMREANNYKLETSVARRVVD
jgi:hypothetical protein